MAAALAARAKGLTLSCIMDPALQPWRHGDGLRVRQILLNLVGNAVKFTSVGKVRVHARYDACDRTLEFDVEDSGIGIAENVLAEIFEPFRQGDSSMTRRFGGTGLGLAISQRIVAEHGGVLRLQSEPGHGATFTMTLPVDRSAAHA